VTTVDRTPSRRSVTLASREIAEDGANHTTDFDLIYRRVDT